MIILEIADNALGSCIVSNDKCDACMSYYECFSLEKLRDVQNLHFIFFHQYNIVFHIRMSALQRFIHGTAVE